MKASLIANPSVQRACHIAKAMKAGLLRHGVECSITESFGGVTADILIAYGWNNKESFSAYRAAGLHFIYIDLGYWLRKPPGLRLDGYHKVVLDDWCPTASMRRNCPDDRFRKLNLPAQTKRSEGKRKIIVAGMSAKSALDHGLVAERWEQSTIERIASQTSRKIVYRPKPSWDQARPLAGAEYCKDGQIETMLPGAHALVTHHSNAAVDAIAAGVPVYCEKGVGSLLSTIDLDDIESAAPPPDDTRNRLLHDIAYLQWNVAEMRDGECWDYCRGLL